MKETRQENENEEKKKTRHRPERSAKSTFGLITDRDWMTYDKEEDTIYHGENIKANTMVTM